MPQFSVIVPIYKTERELPRCLDSILRQDFKDFELLLVDDGSPDKCPEICEEYARKDQRILVIHQENGGVSSARNAGLARAKGDFIWFVDSDDTIEPFALCAFAAHIAEVDADIYIFNDLGEPTVYEGDLDTFLHRFYFPYRTSFGPWNKIYRRRIIEANNIRFDEQERVGEDLLFNLIYFSFSFSFSFLGRKFYEYIERPGSAMHNGFGDRLHQQLRIFSKAVPFLENKVSSQSLDYLFLMHLVAGIGQSREGGLTAGAFAQEMKREMLLARVRRLQKVIPEFFQNEKASLLGRLRLTAFLWLLGRNCLPLAGKVMGLR